MTSFMVVVTFFSSRYFMHRLWKTDLRKVDGKLVKDVYYLNRNPAKVILLDDDMEKFLQPENGLKVRPISMVRLVCFVARARLQNHDFHYSAHDSVLCLCGYIRMRRRWLAAGQCRPVLCLSEHIGFFLSLPDQTFSSQHSSV